MHKKLYLIIIQLVIFFIAANSAFAYRLQLSRVSRDEMRSIYEQLNLSPKQKQSLDENRKKHHSHIKEMMDRINELKLELSQALEKSELDEVKIDEIKDELNNLQSELNDIKLEGIIEVRDILTPEQYDLFQELTQ